MLGKLIKQELKSTYRIFLLIYFVILISSVMPAIGTATNLELIQILGTFILLLVALPIVVIYIVITVSRYYNGLYGEEGYLAFTLPVKSWQLVLSKFLASIIWAIATFIITAFSFFLFLYSMMLMDGYSLHWKEFLNFFFYSPRLYFLLFFALLTTGMNLIMTIYLSISLGNLGCIQRGNMVISIVFFFLINYTQGKITQFINFIFFRKQESMMMQFYHQETFWDALQGVESLLSYSIVMEFLFTVILFFIVSWITSHRLHIK